MRICAYVAGDKNIIYPAIVCLASVKKFNDIDLFIFTETEFITNEQRQLLIDNSINICDVKITDINNIVLNLRDFNRFPRHIFYNYTAPEYLNKIGYDYAIKLDYDILCCSTYDFDDLPSKEEVLAVLFKGKILSYLKDANYQEITNHLNISHDNLSKYKSLNAGVLFINLKKYVEKKFFTHFVQCYNYISSHVTLVREYPEQLSLGLLQCYNLLPFKKMKQGYNFRIHCDKSFDKLYNIHFTNYKPWNVYSIQNFNNLSPKKKEEFIRMAMFANRWIEFANKLNLVGYDYNNKPYKTDDIFNLYILIDEHYKKIQQNITTINTNLNLSVINSEQCTGCSACASICPKNAITMKEDAEGFLSPVLNNELCVHCNLCKEVCPVLHPNKHVAPETVKAAWIKDDATRSKSSSGGLSTALALKVIEDGGVVVGAAMDNFHVHHVIIDNPAELYRIQSSKYVQSDMGDIYGRVKKILDAGQKVMFTGTPCQVAGLQNCLRKPYENLITVDLICHGVPSPGVLRRYVNELKETYYTATSCSFRDKVISWNSSYGLSLYNDSGKRIFREPGRFNAYIRGFLNCVFNRTSCSVCPFTSAERVGDITIADFWKIGQYDASLNDKKGTSLIFLNTKKGSTLFKLVESELAVCKDVPTSVAVSAQAQLRGPAKKSPLRKAFFDLYAHNGRIGEFLEKKLWRVGILNFHFANNFGAVLVPFALSKAVEKLGYPTEIINFFGANPALSTTFEEFRQKYFKRSKELNTKAELEALSPWWKRIIVGSDQVWRLMDTGIYMLNWAGGKKSLISYAASFGHDRYAGSISKAEAKVLLNRFDAISVREASGVDICEKDFGVPALHVLDPTLLLDAEEYVTIIDEEKPIISDKKYVCYAVINGKNKADMKDSSTVLSDIRAEYPLINALFENGQRRSVGGWLEAIYKAEYVIADSFHAVVFSIIFKKQFVAIVAPGINGQDRIPSLLKTLHIDASRIYTSINNISLKSFENMINYDVVNQYLEKEKMKSFDFLKSSLAKSPTAKDFFLKIANP